MRASQGRAGIRAVGERAAPRGAAAEGPVGVHQVRRVRHHLRLRRESDGRQRLRQALPARRDAGVRRDHRAHRRRAPGRGALPQRRGAQEIPVHVRPLPGDHQPPQDQRPLGLAADQGQHRGRPHHHRGKGARQHPEDRPQVHGRRRARQGRDADRPGAVVHGFVLGGGRDGHAVRGRGLHGAFLPHRAGQRHRQPDPAGHQAVRQSAHRAHHERAHRRRCFGAAAQGDEPRTRRATSCSTACSAPPTAGSPRPRRSATASSC